MNESEKPLGWKDAVVGSEVLLEAPRPDLYRINAFRVAELPLDATGRDISRQIEKSELF